MRRARKPAPRLHYRDFSEFDGGDDAYFESAALGSSGLKAMLDPKPLPKKDDDLRFGTAFHWALFQRDTHLARLVREPDFGALQSSKNRDARAAWRNEMTKEGRFYLPPGDFDAVHKMAESCLAIREARDIIEHRETRIEEAQTYRCAEYPGLELRRKPDAEIPGLLCADGKSTKETSISGYAKAVGQMFYDLQAALYLDSGADLYREIFSLGFWHIVAVKTPDRNGDHQAAVFKLSDDTIELGRKHVASSVMLADATRIQGRPTPYLFNACPRTLPGPARWEREQADALLVHARETYTSCTRISSRT